MSKANQGGPAGQAEQHRGWAAAVLAALTRAVREGQHTIDCAPNRALNERLKRGETVTMIIGVEPEGCDCWKAEARAAVAARCSFCDGYGWLYERPSNDRVACPSCFGSGLFASDKPPAGPPSEKSA